MKEYYALSGGRYTYADDLINLQDLALSLSSIFNECDSFVISGCKVSGTEISSGYIYLGGKIRYFNGASGIVTWPQYIYENNETQTIAYESGDSKSGRIVYECSIGDSIPSKNDPVTNKPPQTLQITQEGGVTLKDAFIGKYALVLNPGVPTQTVKGAVNLEQVKIQNLNITEKLAFNKNNADVQILLDGNTFVIKVLKDDHAIEWRLNPDVGLSALINGQTLFQTLSSGYLDFPKLTAKELKVGSVMIQGAHVLDCNTPSDNGILYLNYLGYNYNFQKFRSTIIGNGKRQAMIECLGKQNSVIIHSNTTLKQSLKLDSPTGAALLWTANAKTAGITYSPNINNGELLIANVGGSIKLQSKESVDIGPAIKEGGVLLSEKYVTSQQHAIDLRQKVNADKVFSKEESDEKYIKIAKGLQEIAKTPEEKTARRQEIEAVSLSDVKNTCAVLGKKLSDMARSVSEKEEVCNNIGAAIASKTQSKLVYTQALFDNAPGLKIRMYGNVVCINGDVVMESQQSTVTLNVPNSIQGLPLNEVFIGTAYAQTLKSYVSVTLNGNKTLTIQRPSNSSSLIRTTVHITLTFII